MNTTRCAPAVFSFVVPGHERPDIERVIGRRAEYLIVEKIGEGAEVAEGQDSGGRSATKEE